MSIWLQRFTSHPALSEIESLRSIIAQVHGSVEGDEAASDSVKRLEQVRDYAEKSLQSVDPELVASSTLASINVLASQLRTELTNFLGNHVLAYLDNASVHGENLIIALSQLPIPRSEAQLESLSTTIGSIREASEISVREVRRRAEDLKSQIAELTSRQDEMIADIVTQKGVIATAATQMQSQFLLEQESRAKQFTQAQQVRAEDSSKVDANQREIYTRAAEEQRENLTKLLDDAAQEHQQLLTSTEAQGASVLEAMRTYQADAERILGIVGTTGIISGYKREADAAAKARKLWNGLAAAGILIFTIGSITTLLPLITGQVTITWESLVARLALSLVLGVFGTFAARQAARNENVEQRNRRYELELSSIGPFIYELDDSTRNDLKKQLVDRLFGQKDDPKSAEIAVVSPSVLEVIKLLVPVMKR